MEFTSAAAEQRYDAIVESADEIVVGLDFDGVLSPIVEDPTQAHIHPDAPQAPGRPERRRTRRRRRDRAPGAPCPGTGWARRGRRRHR
ncbi:hypothetical protein [Nocardioides sp. B-3]|uniref:hypothetical protein n=1 Tax=Nocardioides sp. B-3 TaxID=2895565 RepID=UPI002152DD66|nr:hypothetical protein [Nocardioides sp. B-3]UUZ57748.1 hypothetical protein LP418_15115 [Nocardioides sp. B-3]